MKETKNDQSQRERFLNSAKANRFADKRSTNSGEVKDLVSQATTSIKIAQALMRRI